MMSGLALSADGRRLWLTTQTTNTVTVIDTASREVVARIPVGRDPNWVALTPDGAIAVVSNTASQDVTLIDASAQRVLATLPVGAAPKRLAVGVVSIAEPEALEGGDPQ